MELAMDEAEDDELRELKAELARLKAELAEERAKPPPEVEGSEELMKIWDSFPFGDVGQGLQPNSRNRSGPLTAIWRAYFEHTMPGGLKSAALLRFANRTDVEIDYTYPYLKCDWHQKLLEVSLVIHSVTYDTIKMELSDAQGRNMLTMGYFQYDTTFAFPQYPYRVQEQDVLYHGPMYGPNMTKEAAERTLPPGTDLENSVLANWDAIGTPQPDKVASMKSAYLAVSDLGDVETPYELLATSRKGDYEEVIKPYRINHLGKTLEDNDDFPAARHAAKQGILWPLYPVQSPMVKFKPNRLSRGAQYIGWWFGQVHGSKFQGAVSPCMITDLLPWIQSAQPNNPFETVDFCGIFMQCRGYLKPHAQVEVILFSDEQHKNQIFILLNPGEDVPALAGFVKYTPRQGDLYRHEVLLASQGLDFLIAFARGRSTAKASKAVVDAIDLSTVVRN